MMGLLAQVQGVGMPTPASTYASDVDWVWNFIFWVSVFFVVLIMGLLVFFVLRYRRRTPDDLPQGSHHSTLLELGWSLPPLLIMLMIFVWGFRGFLDMQTVPANNYEVLVTGFKWGWTFTHPNGANSDELHIPADRPVKLVLQSTDVIHSVFVPAFRAKKDVVPGRYNTMWFQAPWNAQQAKIHDAWDKAPTMQFDLYCAEYCGTSHSKMLTKVYVHTPESFEAYLEKASNLGEGLSPTEFGALLYEKKTCYQCHSLDGTRGNGPSFKDLWGKEELLTTGEKVLVDDNYLRQAIVDPNAQIVAGYQPVMPKLNMKDSEVTALIAYIKSLSENWQGDQTTNPADSPDTDAPTQPQTDQAKPH